MTRTSGALTANILARTFLRSYFVGAAFNTRGLQPVGLALAMEPGLAALYPDPALRKLAWKRYLKIYNTHPLWTPFLVGVFLSLESRIAREQFPAAMLEQVKSTMVFTLSAVGDVFFGGALTTLWALTTACLLAAGRTWIAFFVGTALFVALNAFKLATFILGYRQGFAALARIRSWALVDWARRLKIVNGALLVVLWALVWPSDMDPALWAAGVALTLSLAVAAGKFRMNRELLVGLGVAAGLFFLWTRV
jgi:PTS system mannose-specific IID component